MWRNISLKMAKKEWRAASYLSVIWSVGRSARLQGAARHHQFLGQCLRVVCHHETAPVGNVPWEEFPELAGRHSKDPHFQDSCPAFTVPPCCAVSGPTQKDGPPHSASRPNRSGTSQQMSVKLPREVSGRLRAAIWASLDSSGSSRGAHWNVSRKTRGSSRPPIHALPSTVEEGVATLQPRPAAPGPEFAAPPDLVASPATPNEWPPDHGSSQPVSAPKFAMAGRVARVVGPTCQLGFGTTVEIDPTLMFYAWEGFFKRHIYGCTFWYLLLDFSASWQHSTHSSSGLWLHYV